jgi:hypothetical protein
MLHSIGMRETEREGLNGYPYWYHQVARKKARKLVTNGMPDAQV